MPKSKQSLTDWCSARGEATDGWTAQHIERCLRTFHSEIPNKKIIIDRKSVDEIANEIVDASGLLSQQICTEFEQYRLPQ